MTSSIYEMSFDMGDLTDTSFGFQNFENTYQPPPEVTFETPSKVSSTLRRKDKRTITDITMSENIVFTPKQTVPTKGFSKILASRGSKVSFKSYTEVIEFGGNDNRKVPLKFCHEQKKQNEPSFCKAIRMPSRPKKGRRKRRKSLLDTFVDQQVTTLTAQLKSQINELTKKSDVSQVPDIVMKPPHTEINFDRTLFAAQTTPGKDQQHRISALRQDDPTPKLSTKWLRTVMTPRPMTTVKQGRKIKLRTADKSGTGVGSEPTLLKVGRGMDSLRLKLQLRDKPVSPVKKRRRLSTNEYDSWLEDKLVDEKISQPQVRQKKIIFNYAEDIKYPHLPSEKSELSIEEAMNIIDSKLKSPFERWANSKLAQQLESAVKCCNKVRRKLPGGGVSSLPRLKLPPYGKKLPVNQLKDSTKSKTRTSKHDKLMSDGWKSDNRSKVSPTLRFSSLSNAALTKRHNEAHKRTYNEAFKIKEEAECYNRKIEQQESDDFINPNLNNLHNCTL